MSVPVDTVSPAAATTQSILAGLFRGYMELKSEQVVVYNQKWKIPTDDRLYVAVSSLGPNKPYGVTTETRLSEDNSKLIEDVAIASREMIGVDIYSAGPLAAARKEEIVMALNSTAGQQLCEKWAIKLARIPLTLVDASFVDGIRRINRYHVAFSVLRTRVKSTVIESYDQFQKPQLVIEP